MLDNTHVISAETEKAIVDMIARNGDVRMFKQPKTGYPRYKEHPKTLRDLREEM